MRRPDAGGPRRRPFVPVILAVLVATGSALPAARAADTKKKPVVRVAPTPQQSTQDYQYNQYLRTASRLVAQGQHSAAVEAYQRLLSLYPDDLNGTRGLADAYMALGQPQNAEKVLTDYLARKGHDEGVRRSLGEVHRAEGRYDACLDDVVQVLEKTPRDQPLAISWAMKVFDDLATQPATADKVEPAVRKLVSHGDRPELRILLGAALLRNGDGTAALNEVTEADKTSSSNGEILFEFADELYGSGREELAEAAYDHAAASSTDNTFKTRALSRLADIALEANRPASAARAYQAMAAVNVGSPFRTEALLKLADVQHSRLADYAGALETCKALDGSPDLGERQGTVCLEMADCLVRLNRFDEAGKALEKLKAARSSAEDQAEGGFLGAEIKFFNGDFDGAQTDYQMVAENFTRTRKANDAVGRYLQIARAKDQSELPALKLYAGMERFTRMGDTTSVLQAADQLETQFAATDWSGEAVVRRAEIARARHHAEDAITLCDKAVAEHPKARVAPYALFLVGDICYKDLHDRKRALTAYEKLLEQYPENLLSAEVRSLVEKLRRSDES